MREISAFICVVVSTIVLYSHTPDASALAITMGCKFELYEDGEKFSGESPEEHESGNSWMGSFSLYGSCKKGMKCHSQSYCPTALRLYKIDDTRIQVASRYTKSGPAPINEWAEKNSEYAVDVEIPTIPQDMRGYHYGNSKARGIVQTIKIDLGTGGVEDITDYASRREEVSRGEASTYASEKQDALLRKERMRVALIISLLAGLGVLTFYLLRRRNRNKEGQHKDAQ